MVSTPTGLEAERRVLRPSRPVDGLEDILELAKQLQDRVCEPLEDEHRLGVRMRLVRAQALSIVDLLTEMTDRPRLL